LDAVEGVLEGLADPALSHAVRQCRQEAAYGTFNWPGVTRTDE
jgi:hypothetical protein